MATTIMTDNSRNSVSVQHWLITGIPTESAQYKCPSSLFPQDYPTQKAERRILRYDELLSGMDKFTDLACYLMVKLTVNGVEAATPTFVALDSPEFEILDRTIILNHHGLLGDSVSKYLSLHPRQQVTTMYRVVERWYLTFHGRPFYIKKHINCPHTVAIDRDGNKNSLFEFTVGEHKCFRDGNIQLTTSNWDYGLNLDELARVTERLHVAFCGDEAIVLEGPMEEDDFSIGVEETNRGKLKVHIHRNEPTRVLVSPYPAGERLEKFKLPQHVSVR